MCCPLADTCCCVETCVNIQMVHKLGQQTRRSRFRKQRHSPRCSASTKPCVNRSSPLNMHAGALAPTAAFGRQTQQRYKSEMNGDLVTF